VLSTQRYTTVVRLGVAMLAVAGAFLVDGCLGRPGIEDRWTRVDVISSNVPANHVFAPGDTQTFALRAAITYRSIVTGFAVTELRASATLPPSAVHLDPEGDRLQVARDIDNILLNSVGIARATRAVTGWDHLIQRIDFSFNATVPAAVDTTGAAPLGLFLVTYLASGDLVELQGGRDTLIITPFLSTDYDILPMGLEMLLPGQQP
jgi:hypothetical protein